MSVAADAGRFRDRVPGAIEDVLRNAYGGEQTPYQWLARSVAGSARLVLDLACGAGSMVERLAGGGRTVIGVDRAWVELQEARRRGRGPLVQGHASYLPFADGSFDAVVSSLGIAVVADRPRVMAEVARILKPGGVFAALTPSMRPANSDDLKLVMQLARTLRVAPLLPGITEFKARVAFETAGLTKAEDKRAKYYFVVRSRDDAERLIAGLRGTASPDRSAAAADFLVRRAAARGAVRVPLPMRRITAIK